MGGGQPFGLSGIDPKAKGLPPFSGGNPFPISSGPPDTKDIGRIERLKASTKGLNQAQDNFLNIEALSRIQGLQDPNKAQQNFLRRSRQPGFFGTPPWSTQRIMGITSR